MRFLVHRTVFPRDFLEDFGFVTVRAQGRVELCRLELAGLAPVEEGRRAKVLRVVQEAFVPERRLRPGPVASPPAQRQRRGAGVGERAVAAHGQEPPVVAVGRSVSRSTPKVSLLRTTLPRRGSRVGVVALAAGADDERADPLERREALVVVVVALEDDIGLRAGEEIPERARRRRRSRGARS